MKLNLRKLQYLLALSEEGHFSRAAARLGVSQPAFSRAITQLEQDCGLRLFDRNRSGATLTAAGVDLVGSARQILGRVAAIEHDLLLQSRGEAGRVRVGAGPLAFSYLMPDLLTESATRWPSLRIAASMQTTPDLIAALLDGTLDFCICAANSFSFPPTLAIETICHMQLGLFVRSEHPLADRPEPSSWEDLRIFPRAGGRTGRLEENGAAPPALFLEQTIDCDDFGVLRRIMLQSDTIWLTGASLLRDELAAGTVREILTDYSGDLP
ncbi:MAG: LysR family transcriptional regulator, partial [Novosphingobium sp.]